MTIAKLVRPVGVPLSPDDPVCDAARCMQESGTSAALVVQDGTVVGIITERDVVRRVVAAGNDSRHTQVSEIMSSPVECIRSDAAADEADARMRAHSFRHLVVLDGDGTPIGVLGATALLRRRIESLAADVRTLESYLLIDSFGG